MAPGVLTWDDRSEEKLLSQTCDLYVKTGRSTIQHMHKKWYEHPIKWKSNQTVGKVSCIAPQLSREVAARANVLDGASLVFFFNFSSDGRNGRWEEWQRLVETMNE